jgi:hypothetical protein
MALVGFTIIRNNFKYDYLLRESVGSVLPVVDRHIIVECFSDDDTYAEVLEMRRENPKIMVLRHPWGKHFTILQQVANFAISHIPPGDWFFQIQADEVMHEDSLPILEALPRLLQDSGAIGARFHYWHFLANYEFEFDFMYRRKLVFAQQLSEFRVGWDSDACQLLLAGENLMGHYGKVHEAKKALEKERAFQAMYEGGGLGFPDPKLKQMQETIGEMDYLYLFQAAIEAGQAREFTGTHPAIMKARIDRAKQEGWEQWERTMPG